MSNITASLSLTDAVDLFMLQGQPRATKVKQLKNRPSYSPATDFYGPLRKHLIEVHATGLTKKSVGSIMPKLTDQKKVNSYAQAVQGYTTWWGNKSCKWFEPPRASHAAHGFEIRVNPELGLNINGTYYVLKLYFKSKPLDKHRANLATTLLDHQLRPLAPKGAQMAIIDVPRGKLIQPGKTPVQIAVVDAELAYVASLWPHV